MTDREIIAHHEAGHAVVAAIVGLPLARASIVAREDSAGRVTLDAAKCWPGNPDPFVLFTLGGPESVRHFVGTTSPQQHARDYATVRAILHTHYGAAAVDRKAAALEGLARAFVMTHATWIAAVAQRLLRHGTVVEDEILDLRPEDV